MQRIRFLIIALLCAVVQGAWADSAFSGGSGTSDSPYLISSAADWDQLVSDVGGGESYSGKYFKLTADVGGDLQSPITTMVGTDANRFSGTFDGDGHTLTVSYSTSEQYVAPFRYVSGATIENLVVGGTITTSAKFAAGLIGNAKGDNAITNCRVNVTIDSSVDGDGTHGGFVANNNTGFNRFTTITGCAFTGSLLCANTDGVGGFVGWNNDNSSNFSSVKIKDCLFRPATLEVKGGSTFARGSNCTLTNCYYTQSFGTAEGNRPYSITAGDEYVTTIENAGTLNSEYSVSGLKFYNVGIEHDGTLFAIKDETVNLTLEHGNNSDKEFIDYVATSGTLSGSGTSYTLIMADADVAISTVWADGSFSGGNGTSSAPYQISSASDWEQLASGVSGGESYSGKYFKLTADLSVSTMVGTDANRFSGIFDGDGHTLTFNYSTSEQYAAPFHYVNGATIKNLAVGGTITTSAKFAAGIIGHAKGTNAITNCRVSATIDSSVNGDGTHGGFVANINSGTTTITGCAFSGSLLCSNTDGVGGFVGWIESRQGAKATIKNSLFRPATLEVKGGATYARSRDDSYSISVSNSYYTQSFGTVQGSRQYSITAGDEFVTSIGNGGTLNSEYSVSGLKFYNVGIEHDGTPFALKDETLSLNIGHGKNSGKKFVAYVASSGTLSGGDTSYTLVMADTDVTITTTWTDFTSVMSESDLNSALAAGLEIILGGDITLENCLLIENGTTAILDLNGFSLRRSLSSSDGFGNVIVIETGGTLTVKDSSGDNSGTITGGWAINGGGIRNHGTLTLEGGTITGNKGTDTSGGVYNAPSSSKAAAATFYMKGGIITGNTGNVGGGIYNYKGSTVVISGGTISNNTSDYGSGMANYGKATISGGTISGNNATTNGGGLWTGSSATTTISGGTIQNNIAGTAGGGVYYDSGTLKMEGNPVVKDNLVNHNPNNLYIESNKKVTVSGPFTAGAAIGVTMPEYERTFTTGFSNYNAGTTPAGIFWADVKGMVQTDDNGDAFLTYNDGTADAPYLINSETVWNKLADDVAHGIDQSRKHFKLTADITVSRYVGSGGKTFNGIFDGDGHTITVNYDNNSDFIAPFVYVDGATIKNLKTAGTIKTSANYAGGIAAYVKGTTTITNCLSTVTIESTVEGDGTHGGLVGVAEDDASLTLEGCQFNGRLLGSSTTHCGGLVGWCSSSNTTIKNCFYNPAEVTVGTEGGATFQRGGTPKVSNSYYTQTLGDAQGKQLHSITAGEFVTSIEPSADAQGTEYTVAGFTAYDTGLMMGSVIYAGSGDVVALTLAHSDNGDKTFVDYVSNDGSFVADGSQYKLTMPNNDVVIGTYWQGNESKTWLDYRDTDFAIGDRGTYDDPIVISTPEQLAQLAYIVSVQKNPLTGKVVCLASDISLEKTVGGKRLQWVPIGWYPQAGEGSQCAFEGTFIGVDPTTATGGNLADCQRHSVSGLYIDYDTGNETTYLGLFGVMKGYVGYLDVKDATIRCNRHAEPYVGIIAGKSTGTIYSCSAEGKIELKQ